MENICESVIKTVTANKRKWLIRLGQKAIEGGYMLWLCIYVIHNLLGRQQAPNPTYSDNGTWKPYIPPSSGTVTRKGNLWGCGNRILEEANAFP